MHTQVKLVVTMKCRAQPQQQRLCWRAGQQRCLQRQHRGALPRPRRHGLVRDKKHANETKKVAMAGLVHHSFNFRAHQRTCFDADPSVVIAFDDDEDTAGAVGLGGGFHHYHIVVTYQGVKG
ncbi:uncharacterized protein LOC125542310 isoform X7 [Triticum urartu]|uniref:uncharacterized protein LOC125542310 isoform X7 n=1 Tax=Triticum urartu TaxID=4572 RepID=UPI0020438DF9|nr:uncharacterized protein LOC125542310 isoform X7 [Triticum urartu]